MAVHKKFPALGRGLDALISTGDTGEGWSTAGSSQICELDIDKVQPNPNQPRREFDADALDELQESIREIGLIQPITVRQTPQGAYTIIAGERRWRACKMAGLRTVTAYIRTVDDENMMEMALVENIQREDLNPVEIALAYQHLTEQYGLTQDALAQKVGKNRPTVTNYLRLLRLPAAVQMALQKRELDMGHARALLTLDNPEQQTRLAQAIKDEGLTVRRVEQMVKEIAEGGTVKVGGKTERAKGTASQSAHYAELKTELQNIFRTKVQFSCTPKGRGKITIPFANEEEMMRIIEMLDGLKR